MRTSLPTFAAVLVAGLGIASVVRHAPALAGAAVSEAPRTLLTWYGHSAFRLVTPARHVLLIDPWITNPSNPHGKQDLAELKDVDLILVSHGHADHVGDTLDILRRTPAR